MIKKQYIVVRGRKVNEKIKRVCCVFPVRCVLLFSCVYENSSVQCVPVRCVLFRHGVHEIHGIAEYCYYGITGIGVNNDNKATTEFMSS